MASILPLRASLSDIDQILPLRRVPLRKVHGVLRQAHHVGLAYLGERSNIDYRFGLLLFYNKKFEYLIAPIIMLQLVLQRHAQVLHVKAVDESLLVLRKNLPRRTLEHSIPLLLKFSLVVHIGVVFYEVLEEVDAALVGLGDLLERDQLPLAGIVVEDEFEAVAHGLEVPDDGLVLLLLMRQLLLLAVNFLGLSVYSFWQWYVIEQEVVKLVKLLEHRREYALLARFLQVFQSEL